MISTEAATTETGAVLRFVRQRADARGLPVEAGDAAPTLESLRWAVEIKALLAQPLAAGDIGAYLSAFDRGEDGYVMSEHDTEPSLAATYYGLRTAALLGRPTRPPAGSVTARLEGELHRAAPDLDEIFYAVRAVQLLGARAMPAALAAEVCGFISDCSAAGGGIGHSPVAPPDIEGTYCGAQITQIFERPFDSSTRRRHGHWLMARCAGGRFRDGVQDDKSPLAMSYWGTHAARLLGARPPWPSVLQLVRRYRRPDGGYGSGSRSTLWETYCALRVIGFGAGAT